MYVTPYIFNISRGSLHDGNGIRTVIYFKGCNLKCAWCHNPEGLSNTSDIAFYKFKCIGCNRCDNFSNPDECPSGALEYIGKQYTVDKLMNEVKKDKHFYDKSGGGVTISGGECLLYPEYLLDLLVQCKSQGINTVVESAFNVPFESIMTVQDKVDSFFIDIKHMDSDTHKRYTGVGNAVILENISTLAKLHTDITIRVPLIPNVNDDTQHIKQVSMFVKSVGIKKMELLKYNNLASSKYTVINMQSQDFGVPQTDERLNQLSEMVNEIIK